MDSVIRLHCHLLVAGARCATSAPTLPSPKAFTKVVLRDVQGLFGGQDLWVFSDGRVIVQVVTSPSDTRGMLRYEMQATPLELDSIQALLDQHHFSDLKIETSKAVPDEAHPEITVEYKSGPSHAVMKMANEKNADFDAIYDQLRALVKRASATKPVFEGAYDWTWKPSTP